MPKTGNPTASKLEGVDELSLAVFRALHDVTRANGHTLARRFAAIGAHIGQAACLRVLDGNDGITQREIAEMLKISRPSITGMLQAVEKSGAIVRKPDEADQRLTRVYLTDKGRALAADLRCVLADYINETIGQMTKSNRRDLAQLLHELSVKIDSVTATDREDYTE